MSTPANNLQKPAVRVFVATTVMLTFISFWRAAAIVLSDLASSAYYVGGDAEKVIGKSAPWFVLAVMLFANGVRAVYIESSAMFVRGGVYRVVKQALGGTLAKLSVSALLFDYILTGPISSVAAGQYLAGFLTDTLHHLGYANVHIPAKSVLDILREVRGEDYPAPIFMISGQGDISMAVNAIKSGALDFIEKPFRGSEIVARLDEAIEAYARRQAENSSASRIATMHFPGREPLTRREREVLEQFTAGASNKEAGRHLGISPRTIEDHRANIMKKLGARNAADLVRIVMTTQRQGQI